MRLQRILLSALLFLLVSYASFGQQAASTVPYFAYSKGLGITAPDSLFSMNIRFRMQNRMALETNSETDLAIAEVEARVRRLRLRLEGFAYSPKLTYLIQLSFSRGDMDYESLSFPNIIRDAYVQYAFTNHFSAGIGQTKLPGNRQRIISSGDQQFVDRSIVNSTFNIDRDFGVQFSYKREKYSIRGAISSGEGRNISSSDYGLAYTGRVDLLPFGAFTNGGDYYEGDLAREKTPKLSIGLAYSHNENAARTAGQLGKFLYTPTDIKTQIVDLLYKYSGWSFSAEYIKRNAESPISFSEDGGDMQFVYIGDGQNYQLGYVFKNNYEIVGRYSKIRPGDEIAEFEHPREHFTAGVNKYFKGHRVKIQGDLTLEQTTINMLSPVQSWIYRLQIEVGI